MAFKEIAEKEERGYQEQFDAFATNVINNHKIHSGSIPSGSWIVSIGADDNLLDNEENLELVKIAIDALAAKAGFEVEDINIYPFFNWIRVDAR